MIGRSTRRLALTATSAVASVALVGAGLPAVASSPPDDSHFPEYDVIVNPRVMVDEQTFPAAALELTLLFLGATERGDFETADLLLASSAADPADRYDFEILPGYPEFPDGVAAALAEHCSTVDICRRPTALVVRFDEPFRAIVTATFNSAGGAEHEHAFAVLWHEGYPELTLFPFQPDN